MNSSLSSNTLAFIDSVLALKAEIAVFDCDGTLWSGDAGEGFFRWELQRDVVAENVAQRIKARHREYLAGRVSEEDMCGEMVTMHAGLQESRLRELSTEFFSENFTTRIFPEMRSLVSKLQDSGCEVWAVSSTNEWVIEAGMAQFAVPKSRILAATCVIDDGIVTDRLIRVPSGAGKTKAIDEVIGRTPDAVFGNSRWDADMLTIAKRAFAVNPNSDLEQTARASGWTVYWPDGTHGA